MSRKHGRIKRNFFFKYLMTLISITKLSIIYGIIFVRVAFNPESPIKYSHILYFTPIPIFKFSLIEQTSYGKFPFDSVWKDASRK